jgi:hypothetical protein
LREALQQPALVLNATVLLLLLLLTAAAAAD